MNQEKLNQIKEKMNHVKVIDYQEKVIPSDTTFLSFKEGYYTLNNKQTIRRESVIRKQGAIDATAIFAITEEKEVLLVIQPRTPLPTSTKVDIEIPAGYIEKNETVENAALRELKEETGYIPQSLEIIDTYYPSLGYSGEKIYIVLALGCKKQSKQNLDQDEFLEYIQVSVKEFKYLLDNNYILDATARLAYYRALEYLSRYKLFDMIGE